MNYEYPELKDRLFKPVVFNNIQNIWDCTYTVMELIEKFIFTSKPRRLTFVDLEFSRILFIEDPKIVARIGLNTKDRRFELHLNIKRIKAEYFKTRIGNRILRLPYHYKNPDFLTRHLPPDFNLLSQEQQQTTLSALQDILTTEELFWLSLPSYRSINPLNIEYANVGAVKVDILNTLEAIIQHEFGHIWMWHLKYDFADVDASIKPYLNIVTDGLINYHLNINPGINFSYPNIDNKYAAILPILFPQTEIDYTFFQVYSPKEFLTLWKANQYNLKTGQNFLHENPLFYTSWRIVASQILNFRKGWSISKIATTVNEIIVAIKTYSLNIIELAIKIKDLFREEAPDENSNNISGTKNSISKTSTGLNFDCIYKTGIPLNEPSSSETKTPDFIDIQDIPLEEMPPAFTESLEKNILPIAGLGTILQQKLLLNIQKIHASKTLLKTLHQYTKKDPARFVIRILTDYALNKITPSYRPTKYPIAKQLALANTFAKSDPPKFYPKQSITEKKSLNTLDIYLDVSGSTNHIQENFFAFLDIVRKEFSINTWQFSTEVYPLSLQDIKQGKIRTTGGTSGECILLHMRQRCETVKNFIVIGDREYGPRIQYNFPAPINILDICVARSRRALPWFQKSQSVHVTSLFVTANFIIEEVKNEVL